MQKQALIFGATGAVGRELLGLCLDGDRYARVTVVARRPASLTHERLLWIEAEMDALDRLEPLSGLEDGDAYYCLGTTIEAAGSEEAFRRIENTCALSAARLAKKSGITRFSMVSAIDASPESRNAYNRTKGEVETAVIAQGIPSLRIFRPSLLKGARSEFRLKEALGNWAMTLLTPVFLLGLRRYQPVPITKLARALYTSAGEDTLDASPCIFESDEIQTY